MTDSDEIARPAPASRLFEALIGSSSDATLEAKIVNLSAATVLATAALVIVNDLYLGFGWVENAIMMAFSLVLALLYYVSRVRRRPDLVAFPFLGVCMVTLCSMWWFNSGMNGTTGYYFCSIFGAFRLATRGRQAVVTGLTLVGDSRSWC